MSDLLTKEKAWTIFRADKLGHVEAKGALNALTKDEFEAYQCWVEDFDLELAKIGVEAQNEAAAILEENPYMAHLQTLAPSRWTVEDYISIVKPFKGSKFEQLHLSAMFRINNAELLLELVKP